VPPTKHEDETVEDSIKPEFARKLGISPEEEQEMEDAAYSGAAEDIATREGLSNTELQSAESSDERGAPTKGDEAENAKVGGYYNRKEAGGKGPFSRFFGSKRGKWIGIGIGGGVAGITMTGFFLLPLKVMHITENLQETFFASGEDAAEETTNRLFSSYVIHKVIPGMSGTCTSTKRNKSCAVVDQGDNVVSQLYRAWRDNNLEGKMAEKHGIEIRRDGNRFSMYKNGQTIFSEVFDEHNPKVFENKVFAEMDRKEVRKEMLKSLEKETFYKRMLYRYKYGKLMERKYGIVRCVIACEYQQDRADRKELRKMKMKAWVIQRMMGPLNEGYALAFQCAVASFDCAKEADTTVDEDGTKKTKFENDLRAATKSSIGDGRMTKETLAKLQGDAGDIKEHGLASFFLKKVFGEAGGKIAGGTIGGLGIADMLATLVDGISKAGPAIKVMNYSLKSGAAVQAWSMYRTNADEVKAGTINVEELGYVADSLGDDFGTDQGGGGAENSPYYADIMGSQGVSTASLFPKAEAKAPYKCDDGSTIASGLCPEMSMSAVTGGTKAIAELGKSFDKSGLTALAGAWNATIGRVFDGLNNLIGGIAGFAGGIAGQLTPDFIKNKAADLAKSIGEWFTQKLFVSFVTQDVSGGRMFETAALGANIAGNDYAHYALGAGKISDTAANNIRYARAMEEKQDFLEKPMFARIFDTSDSHSTVSQLALSLPSSSGGAARTLSTTLLNPLGIVSSTLKGSKKASAAPVKNLDLAGVTQYGYSPSDEIFKVNDYEDWWASNNCDSEEGLKAWAESATMSSENGSFENSQPYPCKLILSVATSNCGYYTDKCLTSDELSGTDEGEDTPPGDPASGTLRVASSNVLGACHTDPHCGSYKPANASYELGPARMRKLLDLWDTTYKLDVVGVQEFEPSQRQVVAESSTWGLYPQQADYDKQFSKQSIIWRQSKYDFVRGDGYFIPYDGGQLKVAWAILQIKGTSTQFRVVSTHDPADSRGNSAMRLEATRKHIEELQKFKTDNIPTYFVGDFNSNTNDHPNQAYPKNAQGNPDRDLSAYCLLTNTDYYRHAYDIANRSANIPCPTHQALGIDHVYVPKDTKVTQWKSVSSQHNSDHPIVFADINLGVESQTGDPGSCRGLQTVHNFRDAAASANVMKPGVLYRSGYLSDLSSGDVQKLSDCLKPGGTIINFLPTNAQNSNDKPVPGVEDKNFAIDGSLNYAKFVSDPNRRREFGRTIEFIANAQGPVLVHCFSGKDRTGWVVAMIMHSLGATNQEILQEYLLSNRDVSEQVTKEQLQTGLDAAIEKYGSVDNYISEGLGLNQTTLDALKQKLGN
jgi:hypothetical protein